MIVADGRVDHVDFVPTVGAIGIPSVLQLKVALLLLSATSCVFFPQK